LIEKLEVYDLGLVQDHLTVHHNRDVAIVTPIWKVVDLLGREDVALGRSVHGVPAVLLDSLLWIRSCLRQCGWIRRGVVSSPPSGSLITRAFFLVALMMVPVRCSHP
jgi:hypothetical protein